MLELESEVKPKTFRSKAGGEPNLTLYRVVNPLFRAPQQEGSVYSSSEKAKQEKRVSSNKRDAQNDVAFGKFRGEG